MSASVPTQIPKLDNADVLAPATTAPDASHVGQASSGSAAPDTVKKGSPKALPYALLGVGLVGVAVGSVFGLKSRSSNNTALGLCPGDAACTQAQVTRHDSLVSDAKTDRVVSVVALGVGAVGLVAGVVLLTTGHATHEAPPAGTWRLRFDADTHGGTALAEGQF